MTDRPLRDRLFRMFIGALVGAGVCGLAAKTGALHWMKGLPGEDFAAALLALMLFFLAIFAFVVSSSQAAYRLIAENYREGDPLDAGVLRTMRISAVILLLAGVLMLAPPLAVRSGASQDASIAVAAAMGVLVLIQSWLNLRVVRRSDELSRASYAETSMISFWVLQLGLYVWAMLAKLNLVAEVSLWTLMIIATAVYLAISIGVAMRRGMFA
jgi:hypothetical protein